MLSDNFTNRLNEAMRLKNLRQVDLIHRTKNVMKKYIKDYKGDGIDKTLLNKYVKGVAIAKQDNIFILAKALDVSEGWLMGYDVDMDREWFEDAKDVPKFDNLSYVDLPTETVKIPVLGKVPAGIPIEAIEEIIGYEEIPIDMIKNGNKYFALKINGDSMLPDYKTGDILIIKQQCDCNSGDDCIVMVNGDDATFKRVVKQEQSLILKPLNNNYEPIYFNENQIDSMPVKIIGIAIEVRRKLKK